MVANMLKDADTTVQLEHARQAPEAGYNEWLKKRLTSTIKRLESGEMKSYPTDVARAVLHSRLASRRQLMVVTA